MSLSSDRTNEQIQEISPVLASRPVACGRFMSLFTLANPMCSTLLQYISHVLTALATVVPVLAIVLESVA